MPVWALRYPPMVGTTGRHPARSEGATDVGIPAGRELQLTQPPRPDSGRFQQLQHQDVGPGAFAWETDWIHRNDGSPLMILIGQATQVQGQPQQGYTSGKHQQIEGITKLHSQRIFKIAHHQDHQHHLGQTPL